jgi:glycosyltransferase involved in cell wall biosynthesis
MTSPFVITASPLSRDFRERLETEIGGRVDVLDLAQLRRLPLRTLLRTLNAHHGQPALLAIEDDTAASVLPVLHAVAAGARATSIELVRADLSREARTKRQLVSGLARLAQATGGGVLAARAARRELSELARADRLALTPRNLDHVLYLNTNMWFGIKAGGSVGHIAGVVNGFLDRGVAVGLASATDPMLVRPEAVFHRLPPPRAFGLPLELNFPRFQRRVVRDLLAHGADDYGFLYQRLSVANYAGVVLSRAFGIPLVLEYNGSEVWAARHWGRPLRFESTALQAEEACLRHAHLVVTVSEVLRDELVSRGVAPERVAWYPNAVDAARYRPDVPTDARSRLGIPDDSLVIGFIGTFGHWHGVEVLARALACLVEEDEEWVRDRRVHVLLVGDGYRMPEVRAALQGRAEQYVTLTGLVPQAEGPKYLAAADVLVSPHVPNEDGSPFFGSPTKLFEYMAMGRAIVASDLQQIGEVLQPSIRTGSLPEAGPRTDERSLAVLTTPGSVDDLVTALRFVVDHPDWRDRLGANARARVLERHTWSHHVDAILDALRATV